MLPNIAVILTDANRKILWVNDDFTIITGYHLTEVLGKKPSILQGPKTEQNVVDRIRKALNNKVPIKDEITNYTKDGRIYPCKLVIYPVFNENNDLVNFIAFEVDGNKVKEADVIPLLNINEKYKSSSLKGIEEVKLFFRFKSLIQNQKLHLKPKVTLKEIADQLSTNTKYLSQVVNHQTNMNFQTFINTYRIEAAKQMIEEQKHKQLTFFGIALQCGFKNKSTFYKVFKELANMTPKQYAEMQ